MMFCRRALTTLLTALVVAGCLGAVANPVTPAPAADIDASPSVVDLTTLDAAGLFDVTNGRLETVTDDDRTDLRWHVNAGQSSLLSLRPDHPLFQRLQHYDRLQFEFRIAGGGVSGINVSALGHQTGMRRHKVHSWGVAVKTTAPNVWHARELDMARPSWFPWDNPDGDGEEGFFRFSALGLEPGTVVELRAVRLVRGLIFVKPDFELPVTWPAKTEHADGRVTYATDWEVMNASGRPTDIVARIASKHEHFRFHLAPQPEIKQGEGDVVLPVTEESMEASVAAKANKVAKFRLTATMDADDVAGLPELYAEQVSIRFAPAHRTDADSLWQGYLVRPLSKGIKRQMIVPDADVQAIRELIAGDDKEFKRKVRYDLTVKFADEFCEKELLMIPGGHQWPSNGWWGNWRVGDFMSEAVDTETGERTVGTNIAGKTWKEYFATCGKMCDNLGYAYLMTGDEKYAEQAVKMFRLYAQQYNELPWNHPWEVRWAGGPAILQSSRISSSTTYGTNWYFRWHCRLMSMTSDSPAWTDEVRREVYEGFVRLFATESMKIPGSISNQTDITNHDLLLVGLLFDDAGIVRHALLADPGVISRMADIDADGFTSEGRPLNYQGAAMSEFVPSILYLDNSGLNVEFDRRKVLEAIRMPYRRAALDGRVPSTGDCGRGQGAGRNRLADYMVSIFPEEQWLLPIGASSTLSAILREHRTGYSRSATAWMEFIDRKPHVFREAGLAVLRSGDAIDEQVMATLDYGRSVFHGARDRNQITLMAFGKVFSHGVGSLYNAGGGLNNPDDPRLRSFICGKSLGHNVVLTDVEDQMPAIGELLAWSDEPGRQVAVSRVAGIQPGVTHTRGLVLTNGILIVLDRVESDQEHVYDWVYHNFGLQSFGDGLTATPIDTPLATQANYENLVDLARVSGDGPIRVNWDLTREYPAWRTDRKVDESKLPTVKLALWQAPADGADIYTAVTGMNSPDTQTVPERAPTVIRRVRAKGFELATVLEPHKGTPRVRSVQAGGGASVTVTMVDGAEISVSLDDVIRRHQVR